ncbi:nmrA-like family domain-containing protein 1 [Amphiura filiformis]|uniref:nmrA-like family domain-containing protein 1 n=1 Tax=Amphiura filiformis TaxID=82378 RepID=UPI003B2102A5
MARVIVVFGATGMQGGGVVTALLKNSKHFKVRAVTRNAKSDKAKALVNQGAEVVEGNLGDSKSLSNILSGCHGVFGVTNYWELFDANKEIQQGRNLVDSCKGAGVNHLIFSGLDDVKGSIGKGCPHFDTKAEIEKYMFASGVPSTSVRYSAYIENMLADFKGMVKKDDEGTFIVGLPMEGKPMDFLSAAGAGNAVASIFASPEAYIGKTIGFSGDKKTIQEYADILSKHLAPKTFKAGEVTAEQFSKFGFPGAEDLGAMFEFYQRGNPERDLALTKQLDPSTQSFEDWVKVNRDALNATYQ